MKTILARQTVTSLFNSAVSRSAYPYLGIILTDMAPLLQYRLQRHGVYLQMLLKLSTRRQSLPR
eukprot:20841-Eustigmatos_ZCMA.PRE.1